MLSGCKVGFYAHTLFTNGCFRYIRSVQTEARTPVQVESCLIGAPAWTSKQIESGDIVERVDGVAVTPKSIQLALTGSDEPGSTVKVSIRRKTGGPLVDVLLHRMASSMVADKRRLFELFTSMKDSASKKGDANISRAVSECIEVWTHMLIEEHERDLIIESNINELKSKCNDDITQLVEILEQLGRMTGGNMKPNTRHATPISTPKMTARLEALARRLAASQPCKEGSEPYLALPEEMDNKAPLTEEAWLDHLEIAVPALINAYELLRTRAAAQERQGEERADCIPQMLATISELQVIANTHAACQVSLEAEQALRAAAEEDKERLLAIEARHSSCEHSISLLLKELGSSLTQPSRPKLKPQTPNPKRRQQTQNTS
jgi:hypothetical protein